MFLLHSDDIEREKAYFPQKFLPQLYKCSRINRMAEVARPGTAGAPMKLPKSWSPSAIRKMNQQINAKKIHLNLCYLGPKQVVGKELGIMDEFNHCMAANSYTLPLSTHAKVSTYAHIHVHTHCK